MLQALTPKVKDCKEELDAQAVGNALYGLHGKDDSWSKSLVEEVLLPRLFSMTKMSDHLAVTFLVQVLALGGHRRPAWLTQEYEVLSQGSRTPASRAEKTLLAHIENTYPTVQVRACVSVPGGINKQEHDLRRDTFFAL
ncbi:hypothetical protein CYMTET_23713 [Cymbomonas tetramitiformis]|uniref:Uncharacterized protein n=1 Tax=Cymbomonas tetramitiformis TaxID=36881 RepID=A0AAE0L0M7_9CHLO|nr:hypothetical protein CYMTET_23713 [Cymbomonas tetramitiformis]